MAINLNKHKDSLSKAWKDVLNDKTDTNWAVFGYEGQTNDLKVVGSGDGGLEEMTEELNSGKIMYAFVKVDDPQTSLPKHVLINWQGEGANTVRKGLCANHLRDIERFFTGANVTVNARNEDEVDPQLIVDKVSKATGSTYSFKTPRSDMSTPSLPIGSNYQRVNPNKEINARERDEFWMKEEQEEKQRVEEERKRRMADRMKQEEEARIREELAAVEREAKMEERNHSIDLVKEAEKHAQEFRQPHDYYVEESEMPVNQSDLLRQQRKLEAQELIAQRTIDARSVFERNTSAGQMAKTTPVKPVRNSILKAQAQQVQVQQSQNQQNQYQPNQYHQQNQYQQNQIQQNHVNQPEETILTLEKPQQIAIEPPEQFQNKSTIEDQGSEDESDQFSTIKRSPKDASVKSITSPTISQQEPLIKNEVNKQEAVKQSVQITEQQFVDEVIYGDLTDLGIQARALYDYQAADDTEITFDPGDVITNIELVDEGWWQGLGPDGTYGLFPANYVELI